MESRVIFLRLRKMWSHLKILQLIFMFMLLTKFPKLKNASVTISQLKPYMKDLFFEMDKDKDLWI